MSVHRCRGGVVIAVVGLFVQVIIICDSTHGDAKEQDARKPAQRTGGPNFLLFHKARCEPHATPCQAQDTPEFDIPGHKIEMAFASDFAPQTDNCNYGNEEFHSIGDPQP